MDHAWGRTPARSNRGDISPELAKRLDKRIAYEEAHPEPAIETVWVDCPCCAMRADRDEIERYTMCYSCYEGGVI